MPKASPNPNPNEATSACEECGLNPWKYRCPSCSIRSCSLPCVKSHKQSTGCTGKRDALTSHVVPLSLFSDDLLISDFKLLEEAKRLAESSHRILGGVGGNYISKLPPNLWFLQKAARKRRISLLFMLVGMSK